MSETRVKIPTLHPDQAAAYCLPGRFKAIRCGRRWGKTELGMTIAADDAIHGKYVGWFAPEYKYIAETYRGIDEMLAPVKGSASKDGVFSTTTGGRIDFWTLENEHAGRSRKYHTVIIDEGAFTKPTMLGIWQKAIRPTLLDYKGRAFVLSNTNGDDPENFMWQICNQPQHGFVEYHAPTHRNPFLPKDELQKLKDENHPLVYQQEYLAEFVSWGGEAFFALDKLLAGDQPVEYPKHCDAVFAVIDSATKTGKANDGTGVAYYAVNKTNIASPLIALDWDVSQIDGDLLITWLPGVLTRLEDLARECGARAGSVGAMIEDKDSGQILLQAAQRQNLNAHAIPATLTAIGKDERAIKASSFVYPGKVKLSRYAYDKTTMFKGTTRNHYVGQIVNFRVGDKDASKRADDLLDCFTYGVLVALGDSDGL